MGHTDGSSATDRYFKPDRHISNFTMSILRERMNDVRKINKQVVASIQAE